MSNSATVSIEDVVNGAQRLPISAVVVGDAVFDTFGGTKRLVDIKLMRVRGSAAPMVWIKTEPGIRLWEPWCFLDEEVTVLPSIEARL